MLAGTPSSFDRQCQRCHDAEAVLFIESVPGGPPVLETGEFCPACVVAVLGLAPKPTPFLRCARWSPVSVCGLSRRPDGG